MAGAGGGDTPVRRAVPAPGTGAEGAALARSGRPGQGGELTSRPAGEIRQLVLHVGWVCFPNLAFEQKHNLFWFLSACLISSFLAQKNEHLSITKFKNSFFASFMCTFSMLT